MVTAAGVITKGAGGKKTPTGVLSKGKAGTGITGEGAVSMAWTNQQAIGGAFEDLINIMLERYIAQKRAVIKKVPTAWVPIRGANGRIVSAKVEEKSTVDYVGTYRGRPIAFEAKHTKDKEIRWDRVEPHQAKFLDDWERIGDGISFVLVGFSVERLYVIPWQAWRNGYFEYLNRGARASLQESVIPIHWKAPGTDFLVPVDREFF